MAKSLKTEDGQVIKVGALLRVREDLEGFFAGGNRMSCKREDVLMVTEIEYQTGEVIQNVTHPSLWALTLLGARKTYTILLGESAFNGSFELLNHDN